MKLRWMASARTRLEAIGRLFRAYDRPAHSGFLIGAPHPTPEQAKGGGCVVDSPIAVIPRSKTHGAGKG